MLSYEDIFARHNPRPLSYLSRSMESPMLRRRVPVFLRSSTLPKDRRPRPASISCLDNIRPASIFLDSIPKPSSVASLKSTPRATSIASLDRTPRTTSTASLDKAPRPTSLASLDKVPRHFSDNYRHATTFSDRHLSRREVPLCTLEDLLDIIREPNGYYELPTDPWNEVYPNMYLSDAPTALCTSVLKNLGVTHVLNAAQGREKGCGQVNTSPGYYSQTDIQFHGVPAFDNIVFRLHPYFEESAQFIDDGLKSGGKVLVHCRAGISRSATLVCAYLMLKKGLTAQEAVKTVRKNRAIIPNDGFLQQLCDLNDKLKRKNNLKSVLTD